MKEPKQNNQLLEQHLEAITINKYGIHQKIRGGEGVVYTRVSSQEQADQNGSLEVQMKYCKEFALSRGIHIREYFGGSFESAKTDGRKEFQQMLKYARKNMQVSFIIVFNYDRFSRTGAAAAQLSEELRKEGIIVKSVTQEIDASTASGRLQENFFHLINNFDNRAKSDRTKLNTREVMLKGYWPYHTPMGYKNLKEKHRACFHEYVITDEGKELKNAFKWKAEGKMTNLEIIARLNAKGVHLTNKNFRWIISNPFYAGFVTGNLVEGKLIKGKHPALVDLKTFMAANDLLQQNPIAGVPKQWRHELLPLKLYAKDEESGQPFTGYKTKGNWYYKRKSGPEPVNIKAEKLNSLFVGLLQQFEYQKSMKDDLGKKLTTKLRSQLSGQAEQIKQVKKKISEKKNQLEGVEERFVLGEISKELYEKYSQKFRDEINNLEQELAGYGIEGSNLENTVKKMLKIAENLSSAWVSAGFETKQSLQRLVFPEGILFDKKNGQVRTISVNSLFAEMSSLARVEEEKENGVSGGKRQISSQVPRTGFEPARPLRAPPPQSGLSTSFNTWAGRFFFVSGLQISQQN